jgi:hypothetical protein
MSVVCDEVGHCNHNVPTVQTEPSCCRCDAGEPCEAAMEAAEDEGDICGLCGIRRPVPGHTACSRCA